MELIDVKVPDIGDFSAVPVIEVFIRPGDRVAADDPLLTLESDKATMDVPAPCAGIVREVVAEVGARLGEGSLICRLEAIADAAAEAGDGAATAAHPPPVAAAAAQSAVASAATAPAGADEIVCELLVLGGGPGGYSAAFRAADLGLSTVLVERYPTLGGVCLNVGCIPSKALLHVTAVSEAAARLAACGVSFAAPEIDLAKLRAHKEKVVTKLTQGLAGMAKARQVEVVRGSGSFIDANCLEVALTAGSGKAESGARRRIRFQRCIIAAGSSAVRLPFLPDDARIVDSTGALELRQAPKKLLVIGGGIIGLEMATVYSALGAQVDVVEMADSLMQGPDRDAVKVWEKENVGRFGRIMRQTKTVAVDAQDDGLWVKFAPASPHPENSGAPAAEAIRYDFILQSVGRTPNGRSIGAEAAGITPDAHGFITVDAQMRTQVPHIFAIGDIVGQPMLAHKAVHQAHVAAEVAAGEARGEPALARSAFDASVVPGVAYTHPEVAWVGVGEDEARQSGRQVEVAKFPWAASGRAIANGAEYGFSKLVFDAATKRVIGGCIVGPSAGDMIGEVALAIEMGADAIDIGRTIHPHPTLGETIGMAAEVAHGTCTDLPPARRK